MKRWPDFPQLGPNGTLTASGVKDKRWGRLRLGLLAKVRSQKKQRYYLGIFPNMGGGLPKSQNFCKFTKYFFVCQIHSEVLKHAWCHCLHKLCPVVHHPLTTIQRKSLPRELKQLCVTETILLYWALKETGSQTVWPLPRKPGSRCSRVTNKTRKTRILRR